MYTVKLLYILHVFPLGFQVKKISYTYRNKETTLLILTISSELFQILK